ncbi:hypothetical protein QBC39DRAFT_372683 [Podospora conica]|nr:hypothetical protein QBC39DRAFT_372683 [Schizothecium conicum]
MCILYFTHHLPCDVRPFLSLAKTSPTGLNLPTTHVDPYSAPLRCSHRFNRSAPPHTACPDHGCCTRVAVPLPCDCADTASWGGVATGSEYDEDIERCPHYREYHRYVCVDAPGDDAGEKWPEYAALDAWVVMPLARREEDLQPNYFCEERPWTVAVAKLTVSGRRLWAEVSRAEDRQRVVEEGGGKAVPAEELEMGRWAVAEAWEEVRGRQEAMRELDGERAEAFLGFGKEGGGGRGGEYPGGVGLV